MLSRLRISRWGLTGGVPFVSCSQSWLPALVAQIGLQGPNPFVFMVTGRWLELCWIFIFIFLEGETGRARNYCSSSRGFKSLACFFLFAHSLFSSTVPLPLQNKTVTLTCRPSLEKLRCFCKQKIWLEMTILFWVWNCQLLTTIWEVV